MIEDLLLGELERVTGAAWEREYKPCPTRRWRLDLALPKVKLAVEIEGRRHGSAKAHVNDSEKFNYLAAAGWTVLRYPASRVLQTGKRAAIVEQIHRVMCGVFDSELDSTVLSRAA